MLTLLSKNNQQVFKIGEYTSFINLENRLSELFNDNFFRVLEKNNQCLVDDILYFIEVKKC